MAEGAEGNSAAPTSEWIDSVEARSIVSRVLNRQVTRKTIAAWLRKYASGRKFGNILHGKRSEFLTYMGITDDVLAKGTGNNGVGNGSGGVGNGGCGAANEQKGGFDFSQEPRRRRD